MPVPCVYLEVKLVIKVLVNLLGVSVLLQKSAQHSQAAHPEDLGGQASFPGTLPRACGQ